MHDDIKAFRLEGTITPNKTLQARERLIKELTDSMRDEGYIPVLDINEQFTREYDPVGNQFHFKLTIYGVESEDAWQSWGMMYGKILKRSTLPVR